MVRALPWAIAAAAAAAALWGWLWREAPGPPPPGAVAPRALGAVPPPALPETPRAGAAPDGAVAPSDPARCAARLADTAALLARCQGQVAPRPCDLGACLADPRVRSALAPPERAPSRLDGGPPGEAPARAGSPAERRALARSVLRDFLGLRPDQERWMAQYVCAVHDQRASALGRLRQGTVGPEVLSRLAAERQGLLRDLESYLGAEKYRTLRSIGGLGALREAFACE